MIERWQLQPAPFPQDPLRFLLKLSAPSSELVGLLRELGPVCGRPRGEKPPYSHALFLEGMTPPKLSRVRKLLVKLSPQGEVALPPPQKAPEPLAPAPKPGQGIPDEFVIPEAGFPMAPVETGTAGPPPRQAPPPAAAKPAAEPAPPPVVEAPPAPPPAPVPEPPAPLPEPVPEPAAPVAALPPLPPLPPPPPAEAPWQAPPDIIEEAPPAAPAAPVPAPVEPPMPEPVAAAPAPWNPPPDLVEEAPPPPPPPPPLPPELPMPPEPPPAVFQPAPAPPVPEPFALPAAAPEAPAFPSFPTDLPPLVSTPAPPPPPPAAPALHPALAALPPLPSVTDAGLVGSLPESLQVTGTAAPVEPPPPDVPPAQAGEAWGLSWPLWPERTLETFQVGAHNRFAHAAAMSVVSAVGSMYNPLNVFGGPGTGKSHLLNAIGAKLASEGVSVMRTSGPRLGLSAAKDGPGFAEALKAVRVLLVDDFDLLPFSEASKPYLAPALGAFMTGDRQLVLASSQPPKNLTWMEPAVGFSFAQGWTVELKTPGPAAFKGIMAEAVGRSGLALSEIELSALGAKSAGSLQSLQQWMSRLKAVREIGVQDPLPALLDLFEMPPDPVPPPATAASDFRWPAGGGDAAPLAFFYPKGLEGAARHVLSKVHAACGQYGLPGAFQEVLAQPYDALKGASNAVELLQAADKAGAQAVFVLGAPQVEGPGADAPFAHGLHRGFSGLAIRCAYVGYDSADAPAAALRAALDLTRAALWTL